MKWAEKKKSETSKESTCSSFAMKLKGSSRDVNLWDLGKSYRPSKSSKGNSKFTDKAGRVFIPVVLILMTLTGVCQAHPIDLKALAQIESSNNPEAVGKDGEIGLYQISPIVLKHFNQASGHLAFDDPRNDNIPWDLKNPQHNRHIANWYLNWLYDRCWTVKDTLIAWNWGIRNWRKWFACPREQEEGTWRECQDYIDLPDTTRNFLQKYEELTGEAL